MRNEYIFSSREQVETFMACNTAAIVKLQIKNETSALRRTDVSFSFCLSLQTLKLRRSEKFGEAYAETLAEFLDGDYARILALIIQYALDGSLWHMSDATKCGGRDVLLLAQFPYAVCDRFLGSHGMIPPDAIIQEKKNIFKGL